VFLWHGFQKRKLAESGAPAVRLWQQEIEALGKIDVNVTFGQDATVRTEIITFDVVDFVYPYNAIFGRNTITSSQQSFIKGSC
jgi:hypothetical protein